MKVVVTIPTYNEVETIEPVIQTVLDGSKNMLKHDFMILVIDGNSPDGTADIVRRMSNRYPNVHLIVEEEKKGLGAAYIEGFKYAMNVLDADIVVEMDGDGQHDPKDVFRLVEGIDAGGDHVIGSRFTEGGSIPEEWEFYRKFLSRYGSIFTKLVLGIRSVNDFTSGFKATRVKGYLDKINFDEISSSGFSYKIELLYKFYKMGGNVVEVPIVFGVRDRGTSKMEFRNLLDSFWLVVKLRAADTKNFLLFMVVGGIGFFVDTFIFNIVVFLSSVGALAIRSVDVAAGTWGSLISGFIAMTVTFILNNKWTFAEREIDSTKNLAISIIVYYISSYFPILIRSGLVNIAVINYGDNIWVNNIAFLLGVLFGVIWNFTVYSKIIWKRGASKDTVEEK